MKGFRVPPQSNKREAQQKVETELQNIQMASRISQMMTQQLMENIKNMKQDLGGALQQLMEMQYKLKAVEKHFNLDPKQLNELANAQRLIDFNAASDSADIVDRLVEAQTINENSVITITSTAVSEKGEDQGIFRSRLKLAESGIPTMIQDLLGKSVGDKVVVKLNNLDHEVEVLSIRDPVALEETSDSATVTEILQ